MENELESISNIQDLIDLNDFMADENLLEAMELAVRFIAKPDMPPAVARKAMLKMQGFSFVFKMQAIKYSYVTVGRPGSDENKRKNAYYSASEQCHNMAQTLKYLLKEQF